MNRENILKVADEIERRPDEFDMQYPRSCIAGFTNQLFDKVSNFGSQNAAIHLGLRTNQWEELFYCRSLIDGITLVTQSKILVPNALRWMVSNNDINWRRAFTAVMMDNAIGKDKT